jgi:hypothetical protein
MGADDKIVKQIIKRHGRVIDLEESPETIIDILRTFSVDETVAEIPDAGSPPGGAPPAPPPGPSHFEGVDPTVSDVMKELKKVQKQVTELRKQIG